MKKISEAISRTSLMFMGFYIYLFLLIVKLSFFDICMILIIDTLAYYIIGKGLDILLFKHFFPKQNEIINNFGSEYIKRLKNEKNAKDIPTMFTIPSVRALWTIPLNCLKILPAGIYFIYFSNVSLATNEAWSFFIAMEVFIIVIFSAITYIELHMHITKFIHEQHNKINLSSLFKNFHIEGNIDQFKLNEQLALIACCSILIIQTFSLSFTTAFTREINLVIPLICGMVLIGRIYYLYRNYFYNGLERIFNSIDSVGTDRLNLAISSSKLLSKFETTFNTLSDNISSRDEEISNWLLNETESSRFRTIGEVSARIGHDIKGPIHATKHFLQELKEDNSSNKDHIQKIEQNLKHIEYLTNNLNTHLRNPDNKLYSSILEVHHEVMNSLKLELVDVSSISFNLVKLEKVTNISMGQSDLVSIFYNLYKNSIKNFHDYNIEKRIIKLELVSSDNNLICLNYTDSGTGLTPDDFYKLTNFYLEKGSDQSRFKRGLGLRLIKKMIESQDGTFNCLNNKDMGTKFEIKLPVRTMADYTNKNNAENKSVSHDWMN